MKIKATVRRAYVHAEVVTGLAHQIRAIRIQRGLTQGGLAKVMNTTQASISRLEDPSYGRYSLKTLLDLSTAFDTGLQVRFVSLVNMLHETFIPNALNREVLAFEEEAPHVGFYRPTISSSGVVYIAANPRTTVTDIPYMNIPLGHFQSKSFPISISIFNDERVSS